MWKIRTRAAFLATGLLFSELAADLAMAAHGDPMYDANSGKFSFAHGLYAAIGPGPQVRTSVDDNIWTERFSHTPSSLHAITHGNGLFVAVGNEGVVVTSPDGITWSARNSGTDERLRGIAFGKETFVAVGYAGTVITSKDGLRWKRRNSGTDDRLQTVTFDHGSLWLSDGKASL
jgi:hypothetical protein